jgi:hypothetical protein
VGGRQHLHQDRDHISYPPPPPPPHSSNAQIRCADLYKPTNSSAGKINSFSACVISENHCVPRVNETCTVPHTDVTKFDLNQLTGHWCT